MYYNVIKEKKKKNREDEEKWGNDRLQQGLIFYIIFPKEVHVYLVLKDQTTLRTQQLPLCESAINSINRVISDDMNDQLSLEFKTWEVQQAIKQIAPFKTPGPDGIPYFFY